MPRLHRGNVLHSQTHRVYIIGVNPGVRCGTKAVLTLTDAEGAQPRRGGARLLPCREPPFRALHSSTFRLNLSRFASPQA